MKISDARDLWVWRNDPTTVGASLSAEPVAWEDHKRWVDHSLRSDRRVIYILEMTETAHERVGMCRFDLESNGESAEISVNLNPIHRGKRLSLDVLKRALALFRAEFPNTAQITARIRDDNLASKRLFASAGFERRREADGVGNYTLNLPK